MTGMGGIRSAVAAALGVGDDVIRPDAAAAEPGASAAAARAGAPAAAAAADQSLLALVDRLTDLLDRSDLAELEVRAGGTGLVLRKVGALRDATIPAGAANESSPEGTTAARRDRAGDSARTGGADERGAAASGAVAEGRGQPVLAPLTGIFYASPAPTAPAFVKMGQEIVVGQVIGLIEAMKLFNEIKSDRAGRVSRVVAVSGALVKAKEPLIEVEPL